MGWKAVMMVGFLLEFIGLGIAAFGLWKTWRANANGRPFFSPRLRAAARWIRRHILRRSPRTQSASGTANGTISIRGDATGTVTEVFTEDMTLEEKVNAAQENAVRALKNAATAQQGVEAERRAREAAVDSLTSQLQGTQETLTTFARELVVDGVPLTVGGLVFAAVGLTLQALATAAMF
jgi:hypothetical protein